MWYLGCVREKVIENGYYGEEYLGKWVVLVEGNLFNLKVRGIEKFFVFY